VVDDLKEFFTRPGSGIFCAEIVQDENVRFANILKPLIVLDLARRTERRAQMVEQVGHNGKEDAVVVLEQLIGDGSREMCFAAAIVAEQNEPSAWMAGVLLRAQIGAAHAGYIGVEGLERLIEERRQVADLQQTRRVALLLFRQFADARKESGEIGMTVRNRFLVETGAAAVRTFRATGGRRRRCRGGRDRRRRRWCIFRHR
jgi:hypothetical protein